MIKGIEHMYVIDQSKLRESKTFSSLRSLVGVLGPTAHPGLPLKVFLGVGRCRQL
jgi:hypothetical protein